MLWSNFASERGRVPHFNALVRGDPHANITVGDISLKTTFFVLHFRRRKYRRIFNHLYVIRPKATEFGEITVPLGLLRRSRSFKVTDFGIRRKVIYDFILVINSNLRHILHRFWDMAVDRSKIAIFD